MFTILRRIQNRSIAWAVLFVSFFAAQVGNCQETEIKNRFPRLLNRESTQQDEGELTEVDEMTKAWNIPLPTLGGKQFWTDHRWWYGWRVQYNSTLDHWRLLDPKGIRRAWGGKQAMLDELETVKQQESHPPIDEVVLLLHGLFRSPGSMSPVAEAIDQWTREENKHPKVAMGPAEGETYKTRLTVAMTYASTRDSVPHHSDALREIVENLPGEPSISFVGHSLGNIVFRHAIGKWSQNGDPKKVLTRLNRAVMLGPPNQGSSLASQLGKLGLFETITGSSGVHLGMAWEELQQSLGTPPCPFAIVVGDISNLRIQNPLLEGPSDGVVTTQEAYLDGATEIRTFPVLHSFLMKDPAILKATISFLQGNSLDPR